jgi:hypothetical protein
LNVSLANPSQRSHFLTLLITSHVLCSVSTSLFRKYGEKNFRKRSLGHFHDCFLRWAVAFFVCAPSFHPRCFKHNQTLELHRFTIASSTVALVAAVASLPPLPPSVFPAAAHAAHAAAAAAADYYLHPAIICFTLPGSSPFRAVTPLPPPPPLSSPAVVVTCLAAAAAASSRVAVFIGFLLAASHLFAFAVNHTVPPRRRL